MLPLGHARFDIVKEDDDKKPCTYSRMKRVFEALLDIQFHKGDGSAAG
jgi:hypothetical protein